MAGSKSRKKTAKTSSRKGTARKKRGGRGAELTGGELRDRWVQVGLIAGVLASLFLFVALLSYQPHDSTFFLSSSERRVTNLCGPVGAWAAGFLYQLLGYAVWSLVVVPVWLIRRLAHRPRGSAWQVLVLGLLVLAFAAGAELAAGGQATDPFPPGGLLGLVLATWLAAQVGILGAWLVVAGMVVVSGTLVLGTNWRASADRCLRWVEQAPGALGRGARAAGSAIGRGLGALLAAVGRGAGRLRERWGRYREAARARVEAEEPEEDSLGGGYRDSRPSVSTSQRYTRTEVRPGVEPSTAGDPPTRYAARELVEAEWDPTDESVPTPRASRGFEEDEDPVASAIPVLQRQEPDEGASRLSAFEDIPSRSSHAGERGGRSPRSPVPAADAPPEPQKDADGLGAITGAEARSAPAIRPDPSGGGPFPQDPPEAGRPASDDAEAAEAPAPDPGASSGKRALAGRPDAAALPDQARRGGAGEGGDIAMEAGCLVSGGDDAGGRLVLHAEPETPFELPALSLLDRHERDVMAVDEAELRELARSLEEKLESFGVKGQVKAIRPGPVITIFEYLPGPGIKISRISNLTDDIAMAMRALRVRIVAPIPGKGVVGIEIPNKRRQTVWIRDLLVSDAFRKGDFSLPLTLGKSVDGHPVVADLTRMPHLLVGGTTGSGKSVGINAMMLSMLFCRTPDELRFILIDPKMLEFELYQDIPHLLHPVVTDVKLAAAALKWACSEMDARYRILARWGTRSIWSYNRRVVKEAQNWTPEKARRYAPANQPSDEPIPPPEKLPHIVIVIDELADLMMQAAKEVEESIVRLAQKARAAGIHLIVATQRPSVDVITGLIKANMPARIAFQVRSKTDGRTILDQNGAETLLGKGDMLFLPPGVSALERIHGPFVSDEEVRKVADFLRDQGDPEYSADIRVEEETPGDLPEDEYDEYYDVAVRLVTDAGKASTSMVQRHLKIGYNRAARIIEQMERDGVVGPADGARPREVLVGSMPDS